jgi:hypothetical protein
LLHAAAALDSNAALFYIHQTPQSRCLREENANKQIEWEYTRTKTNGIVNFAEHNAYFFNLRLMHSTLEERIKYLNRAKLCGGHAKCALEQWVNEANFGGIPKSGFPPQRCDPLSISAGAPFKTPLRPKPNPFKHPLFKTLYQ